MISIFDIIKAIKKIAPDCIIDSEDSEFDPIPLTWFRGKFIPWWDDFKFRTGIDWKAFSFDCDNFARQTIASLDLAHYQSEGAKQSGNGLLKVYLRDRTGFHMVVILACAESRDASMFELWVFDPQDNKLNPANEYAKQIGVLVRAFF